jgi:hypothetical protein
MPVVVKYQLKPACIQRRREEIMPFKTKQIVYVSVVALMTAGATSAAAQNLKKLQDFKTTGTALELETVPQTGTQVESLNKILQRIKLPSGFKIGLYAIVPDARHMAVGNNVGTVFVGTRKTAV